MPDKGDYQTNLIIAQKRACDFASILCGKMNSKLFCRYSSNDESVATVTSNGRISARAKGTAQITVSSHNGKTVAITVVVS